MVCHGLPPKIAIPLGNNIIVVQLIHDSEDASRMVGYQVRVESVLVISHKLFHSFKLGDFKLGEIQVSCKQLSGHITNNNKQVTILTGQYSCSGRYPMSCCMVYRLNLGMAPVWIQWQLKHEGIASMEWVCSLVVSISTAGPFVFTNFTPTKLPESVLKMITEFLDCKIILDLPQHTGNVGTGNVAINDCPK